MLERFKVRAVCEQLGIKRKEASILVHVHGLTHGGEIPDALVLKPGETVSQKLGPLTHFESRKDALGDEMRGVGVCTRTKNLGKK